MTAATYSEPRPTLCILSLDSGQRYGNAVRAFNVRQRCTEGADKWSGERSEAVYGTELTPHPVTFLHLHSPLQDDTSSHLATCSTK